MAGAVPVPGHSIPPETARLLLASGKMSVRGLLTRSSNYTFLVTIAAGVEDGGKAGDDPDYGGLGQGILAVYKPRSGERPLWDFPDGTLAHREVAAYMVSEALGWNLVPPTILRDGPKGPGMVQLYIHSNPEENYFTLRQEFPDQFRSMALFDAIINNADRKAGHCLRDDNDHIWGIDHGVCFHEERKLRTVIWQFAGTRVPPELIWDLKAFREHLGSSSDPAMENLRGLLTRRELDALRRRTDSLIETQRFPSPAPYERHTPWPPI